MKSKHFSRSFKPIVQIKPGEMCSWKRHYRGALRELVGILNLWASNDAERFVPAGLDAMVRHCKRYKGKGYSRRQVLYALRELRAREIVSKPVTRFRFGQEITGVIVAAHDTLAARHDGCLCVFHGFDVPQSALPIALKSALPTALLIALQTAPESALPTALPVSPQTFDSQKASDQKRADNRLSLATKQTRATAPANPTPVTGAAKNGNGTGRDGVAAPASSSQSFTAEEKLWQEMRNHDDFPEEMITAVPRKDEKRRVVEQLKTYGVEVVMQAMATWADERDMPLSTLGTRWRAWLEEGEPLLRREAQNA